MYEINETERALDNIFLKTCFECIFHFTRYHKFTVDRFLHKIWKLIQK
jgi:hypothetical protein